MRKPLRPIWKKLLLIPPVIGGVLFFAWMVRNRSELERSAETEVARVLRVIHVDQVDVVPRALGYGTAEPGSIWKAVAEVQGRVTEAHADLEPGSIISKDDVVLKLDRREYELAVARLQAEIEQAQANLDEMSAREINDKASLEIEQDSLTLAVRELERIGKLFEQKTASASELEQQKRNVLLQRQSVQALTNSLNLFPSSNKAIKANIAVKTAQLAQANLDLGKTIVKAPFDCRIGPVTIEVGQFLAAGQTLFEAHNVNLIEIETRVAPRALRNLLQTSGDRPITNPDMETMRSIFKIDAIVRFGQGDYEVAWPARFARVRETLDPATRTFGVVFAIDDPYKLAVPGRRPPPFQGTFCEVELRSKKRVRSMVVPRTAVHDRHVYVVGPDSRLAMRPVEVAFAQSGFVAIGAGLEAGELVVVSDPTPAIEGMLVDGVRDLDLEKRLTAAATGEGSIR